MSTANDILTVLQSMNAKLGGRSGSGGTSASAVFEGSAAADISQRALRSAMGAAPAVSGTLSGHMDLLLGSIGGSQEMTNQVVALTAKVNDLRNAWQGASSEVKSMSINSVSAIAGMALLGSATSRLMGTGTSLMEAWRDAKGPLGAGQSEGFMAARLRGFRGGGNLRAIGYGGAIAGLGAAANATFGESYAGDALETAGVGVMTYHAIKSVTSSKMVTAAIGARASSAIPIIGTAAAIYASLPRGNAAKTGASDGDPASTDVKNSLGYANEFPMVFAGLSRSIRASVRGEYEAHIQAMRDSGIFSSSKTLSESFSKGGVLGVMSDVGHNLYGATRNLSEEEMDMVARNTTRPGSVSPKQHELDRLTMAMNFQSRQIDIGDFHGAVQAEAVRSPMQQQQFENLITSIENLRNSIDRQNGGGSMPSGPPTPS